MSHYSGWDQEIFDGLGSKKSKEAYRLAAYLHDGINRKNGLPYLTHINGSLQKLDQYIEFIGNKFNKPGYEMYICLHDIIEDDDDGVDLIENEFGIDVLIDVLWMSIPKKRVRDGVERLIQRKPEYIKKLNSISTIHTIPAIGRPTDGDFMNSVHFLLPGDWLYGWDSMYSENYKVSAYGSEERRDIFAKYIFAGMIENMPEHLFLVKCIERLDNLRDREGLKTIEGLASYQRTVATTLEIYCKRLDILAEKSRSEGFTILAGLLRLETVIGIDDIMRAVPEDVRNIVIPSATST